MSFNFPWSNLHELNLDWILRIVKQFSELIPPMSTAVEDVQALQGDVAQAVEDAQSAVTSANQAAETAAEALEVAEQAAAGTIADGAVITSKIANGAVTSAKIEDGTIQTIDLADGSVTSIKLASNAVTTAKIADNAVLSTKISDDAVTNAKIADNAVTNAKLADNAVNTAEIVAGAVTNPKIADNAINTAKLDSALQALVQKLNTMFPTYENYISLESTSQGSTFTVERTGFYSIYITAQTSGSNSLCQIRTNNRPIISIVSAGGSSASYLAYLESGKTYTLTAIANVSDITLYY